MPVPREFADYCCELLASLGACTPRRMFGGWGISLDGLTVAIATDLGSGQTLWLKADDETRSRFEATGCARFTYGMRQRGDIVDRSMNYYSAPEEAMDSAGAMAPWARLALQSALAARAAKGPVRKPTKKPPTSPRSAGRGGGRRASQG